MKVSDKVVPVRIDAEHASGRGWVGTNVVTGRQVRIKSPQRLRAAVAEAGQEAPGRATVAHVEKKADRKSKSAKAEKKATRANTGHQAEKPPTSPKASKAPMSGLDAAAKVLAEAGEPLSCKEMVERMLAKGYWTTEGKTPAATIYSAIIRQIAAKGEEARFRKAAKGKFTLAK